MSFESYEPTYIHVFGENRRVCDTCIAIEGILEIPDFYQNDDYGAECQQCYEYRTSEYTVDRAAKEFKYYLDFMKTIRPRESLGIPYDAVMLFSGGIDSVFALSHLQEEFKKRGLTLGAVLIDHGMKGEQTMKNALHVCRYVGVDLHIYQNNLVELFTRCYEKGIFACGRKCNEALKGKEMMDKIMNDFGVDHVLTGGDTLIKTDQTPITVYGNRYELPFYSIWHVPTRTVRVVGAYNVTKEDITNDVSGHMPWVNPGCGGYDTDCLHPGLVVLQLTQYIKKSGDPPLEVIIERGDPLYPFFAARLQFLPGGKPRFDRKKVLHNLVTGTLDGSSAAVEAEALTLMKPFLQGR